MTIKRQWMLVLLISVALSVIVNSLVLSFRINRYFVDYSTENYQSHVSQVVAFSTEALSSNDYTTQQLDMQLASHLSDPINRIRLYRADGVLLADVGGTNFQSMGMMRNEMMNRMMGATAEEVDSIDIQKDGAVIGKLIITRYSSIGESLGTRRFLLSLVTNSLISFGIVFAMTFVLGYFISKRMSKDLMMTAQQAVDIDLGRESRTPQSHVLEIKTIQQSLETLHSRLMLKQTSRKKLIDELVHQTRTPLTILRTHLEGFQDGVIQFTPDEVKTCEAQIENLSSIITNMSGLIDAGKEIDRTQITAVELSGLIRQIVAGLKAQFNSKPLALQVLSHQKVMVQTDPYQLSQAIYNLLTNAFKFTEPSGSVAIAYEIMDSELVISIRDTGIGISSEDQVRVFDAYFRGNNALNTAGEGIGLYIVKENLRKIGGSIELESALGEGSKFTIRLPVEQQ
ncbi:MAG: HAMP domain-containing sensor histidine kinase [Eubacteriales bacterium]|nr:HAMP domain-containing sensor histidine kinase [Eubacteriales bacterium]